jgi:hypothetical protein
VNASRKNLSENRHFEKEEGSSPRKRKKKKRYSREITKKNFRHRSELNYIRRTTKVSEHFFLCHTVELGKSCMSGVRE